MARCLLIGCGCRGLALAGVLRADGHAVRGTTRRRGRVDAIAAAGVEPWLGDPDRVGSLAPALEHVTVAAILLGSASGSHDQLVDLHGTRLEMLLTRILDTTIRGILYESSGTVASEVLRRGGERIRAACEASLIPYRLLAADPSDHDGWAAAAHAELSALLEPS